MLTTSLRSPRSFPKNKKAMSDPPMALKLSLRRWSATAQGNGRPAKAQKAKEEPKLPSQHLHPFPIAYHGFSADLKQFHLPISEVFGVFKKKICKFSANIKPSFLERRTPGAFSP
jgi:hypothetical protein